MTKRKPGSTTPPRVLWLPEQLEELRRRYPNERTDDIARSFGFSMNRVYSKASDLGLHKSEEFFASEDSGRTDGKRGAGSRFVKGQAPANKGVKRPGTGSKTSFKSGQVPYNHMPVGSERIAEGYIWVKLAEPKYWKQKHHIVWKEHHGEYPPDGYMLAFRDGNKLNVAIDNLELISRAEWMKRNTIHNYPPELKSLIRLKAKLTRRINEQDR